MAGSHSVGCSYTHGPSLRDGCGKHAPFCDHGFLRAELPLVELSLSKTEIRTIRRKRWYVRAQVCWVLFVTLFSIPVLVAILWYLTPVSAYGREINEHQDSTLFNYMIVLLIVATALWGSAQIGPASKHLQWIMGVLCISSTWLWTTLNIGIHSDQTYTKCTYSNCWPVGYQEWVIAVPIVCTSIVLFAMGTIGLRLPLLARKITPVVVFTVLYLVFVIIWRPVMLPYFEAPPPAWSF